MARIYRLQRQDLNSSPVTLPSLPSPHVPYPEPHAWHKAGTALARRLAATKPVSHETVWCGARTSVSLHPWGFWSQHDWQCVPRRKCSPGGQDAGFSNDVMRSCARCEPARSSRAAAVPSACPAPAVLSTRVGDAPSGDCALRSSQPRRLGGRFCLCLIKPQQTE